MGMVCGRCGDANRDGARFCASCGERLLARCTTCDAELVPGARFCDACGAPAAAGTAADVVEQARKTVTVLFADLAGSTAMHERMDPEAVRAFNARCYATMRAAIERHGGRVVKFVGDGMMAVFGVPDVREDDARRAVAAAAELRGAVDGLRVGVNTGEVVVVEGDDDVVGDAVNVAARLEAAAPVGGVLVGPETYRLVRDHADLEPARELHVKGRQEPVAARLLVALRAAGDDRAAGFVGRDGELARLVAALGTVEATGRARLLTVLGSPGVGKSRLLAELDAAVADAAEVLVGRCDAAGGSTFEPVAGVVARALDVAEDVDDDVRRAVGFLVGDGEPATPERTFWGVRRVIEAAARRRPVLVVVDDVHWAEPMLLDLVEHLAEWLGDSPVLVVVAGRPELRELRPSLVEGGRATAVLSLEGLDADATRRLAAELLGSGGLPPALARRVAEATDGNPLFVRELVRMLVDDGVLRADGDSWTLTVDEADIDVPPTITSLLAARIERLRADERTVLERASVLGRDVVRGALAHLLAPRGRAELPQLLESLRRKELLEPAGTYWIDEPVLRFHHVLIREAAYRRLLKEARAELHERVAGWFVDKTAGGAEHDELVGFHLEQSQANRRSLGDLDDHGRAVAVEAARRLGAAAHRTLQRDDLAAAASLSERALACLDPGDPGRTDLLLIRCEALLGSGDVAAARPVVDELASLAAGDDRLEAWTSAFAVQLASLAGTVDLVEADERARRAAERLTTLGDAPGAAKAHRVRASVLARLGRVADTEAELDRALTAAREANDRRQISGVLAAAPLAALWGPSSIPRAGGRCLDVVRLLRITTGAREVEAVSMRCQAVLEALRGRDDAARTMLGTARRTLEDLGVRHGLLELELFTGIVELVAGQPVAAEEHLRAAHEGFADLGVDVDAAQAAALRGRAALAVGDVERALALADLAERLGERDLKTAIAWRAVKAEVLARQGSAEQAVALAQAAVELAERTDALLDRADALAALATVLGLTGDADGARAATDRARALYDEKGATALAGRLAGDAAPPSAGATGEVRTDESHVDAGGGASEAPEHPVVAAMRRSNARALAGEWDEWLDLVHPAFVYEDRRAGLGRQRLDRDACLQNTREGFSVGIDAIEVELLAAGDDQRAVLHSRVRAAGFAVEMIILNELGGDGRARRSIVFDADALDDALAALEELAVERGDATAETEHPVVLFQRWADRCMLARDWDELATRLHDDLRFRDDRPGFVLRYVGPSAHLDHIRQLAALGVVDVDVDLVEAASDDAALIRLRVAGADSGIEVAVLSVVVLDAAGRATDIVLLDDEVAGRAALERLAPWGGDVLDHVAARHPTSAAVRLARALTSAFNTHDWDRLEEIFHDDVVHVDHRPASFGTTAGASATLARLRSVADLLPDVRASTRRVLVVDDGVLLAQLAIGSESFRNEGYILLRADTDGSRLIAYELFGLDQEAEALRRTGDPSRHRSGETALRNRATDAWFDGKPAGEVLAVRGDDLAVVVDATPARAAEPSKDPYVVVRIDRTGAVERVARFGDVLAAVAELGRLYLQDGPSVVRVVTAFAEAFNQGDWDQLASLAAPDLVQVDHRPSRITTDGPEQTVAAARAYADVIPDHVVFASAVLEVRANGVLSALRRQPRSGTGHGVEDDAFGIFMVAGERVTRIELFPPEDEAAARARFGELSAVRGDQAGRGVAPPET